MAGAIGPGDFVECIDTEHDGVIHPSGRGYRAGEICLVEECGEDEFGGWLNCRGKVRPADYGDSEQPGWDICWFRPIYRPDESLIASLLKHRLVDEPVSA